MKVPALNRDGFTHATRSQIGSQICTNQEPYFIWEHSDPQAVMPERARGSGGGQD